MEDEETGGEGAEDEVEVAAGEGEGLGGGLGEMEVVASRDGAADAVDGSLDVPILRGWVVVKGSSMWVWVQCLTIMAATSPSLLHFFHCPTPQCLNRFTKGYCQAVVRRYVGCREGGWASIRITRKFLQIYGNKTD